MKQYDIGIDLGTTSIIIATEEQGVVFRQPTIGAVDTRTNSILAAVSYTHLDVYKRQSVDCAASETASPATPAPVSRPETGTPRRSSMAIPANRPTSA